MPNEFNEKLNEESIRARSFYTATVFWAHLAQPYSETCQTSKIECFVKIVDAWKPLTIYVKCSILDVWQGSEYSLLRQEKNSFKVINEGTMLSFLLLLLCSFQCV